MNNVFNNNYESFYDKDYIVLPTLGKSPQVSGKDWQIKTYNCPQKSGDNIGLITGKPSGVICIDIDTKDNELKDKIYALLPPLYSGKIGNKDKGNNYFFAYSGEKNRKILNVVELLSTGNMTILPPSMHPECKYEYSWVGVPLNEVDQDNLPKLPENFMNDVEKLVGGTVKNHTLIDSDGSRCKGGSHMKLSEMGVAACMAGEPMSETIKQLLAYDLIHNPDISYFLCPSRPEWKVLNREMNANKFVSSIYERRLVSGEIDSIEPASFSISIGDYEEEYAEDVKSFRKIEKLVGLGKHVFDDLYNNSPVPRSQFCFMNTMNLISMLIGNKAFLKGTAANLYQYGAAPSGFGKDFSFKRAKQMITDCGLYKLIGTNSPTSETVVLRMLSAGREKVMYINEAESLLKKVSSDNQNHGLREILTDLYDYGGRMHTPKMLTNNSQNGAKTEDVGHVFSPFLNINMASTIRAFENHAGIDLFNTGFGSRFLFYFEDRYKRQRNVKDFNPPMDMQLIASLKKFARADRIDIGDTPSSSFEIDRLIVTPEAESLYNEYFEMVEDQKKSLEESPFLGLVSRKLLFINKFALIHHCMKWHSQLYVRKPLTADSYEWAYKCIDSIMYNMMNHLDDTVSDSQYGKTSKDIFNYIKKRTINKKPTAKTQLHSRFRDVEIGLRVKIINDLMGQAKIRINDDGKYISVVKGRGIK